MYDVNYCSTVNEICLKNIPLDVLEIEKCGKQKVRIGTCTFDRYTILVLDTYNYSIIVIIRSIYTHLKYVTHRCTAHYVPVQTAVMIALLSCL